MPDFPIVDGHLHLYDPAVLSFPWMKEVPALDRPHLVREFDAAREGLEVEAAVFVEVDAAPGAHVAEARFIAALARNEPRIGAIVAHLPMDRGAETARDLEALREIPLVRGIRHLIQGHRNEPGWALRPEFVSGVQGLAGTGLVFDICIYAEQLPDATELVARCPKVQFVLDHLGKPDVRGGGFESWSRDVAALAQHPNVACKISGLATEADHATWREEELVPYIDRAIEVFGFERVLFGGDWPVSTLATGYRRWVECVDRAVAGASEAERRQLFVGNAGRLYRF